MTTFKRIEEYTIACPSGDGGQIVKNGRQRGHQRYLCRTCGKNFREPDAFQESRRFPVQQIGSALQWYFDGLSYREVARNIGRTFRTAEPAESNVFRWIQGYSRGAIEALKDYKVNTGKEWVADEMQVNLGGKDFWVWTVMDRRSRFLLATHLTPKRDARAAEIAMRKAKEAAANLPEVIRTDQLRSYGPAIQKLFGKNTKHLLSQGIRAEVNNNLAERVQGTIRERDKVLRSMKKRETGQNYLDGWMLDYNYFRPHLGLNRNTPAQVARLRVPFRDWQDVAQVVEPILKTTRPRWHTQDEVFRRPKDFRVMKVDEAVKATRSRERSRPPFRVRRGP